MLAELEPLYSRPPTLATPDSSGSKSNCTSDKNMEEGVAVLTSCSGPSIQDILSFFGITIMLVWPWIFFGVVCAKKGIQMNDHLAQVVKSHPNTTTYLITFICSITSMIISELFSLAIIRLAQELVTYRKPTQPFHLTVLLAFRRQTWPWGKSMKDAKYLMTRNRWLPAASVIVCVLIFPHLISSTTTLLTPTSFNRTAILTGTELNFASTDAACLDWFNANPLSNTCGVKSYHGQVYANCLGGVDILEAGRGKVLELLTNNSESLTFAQLGDGGGLHFRGSMQGILPIGPNGVPAFNTLESSPLSKPEIVAGMISYDYTLNHQGFTSNVNCSYDTTNPFQFRSLDPGYDGLLAYNASCATFGEFEALTDVKFISTANIPNLLVYWACQSVPNNTPTASYTIYLAGIGNYGSEVGNITCTVNPIQAAIFPVTYQSTANIFTTAEPTSTASPIAYSKLIYYALSGLLDVIVESQSLESNLLAESVFVLGAKSSGMLPQRNDHYLKLFEGMIQGIIEYEMTYLRLLYSAAPNAPPSCFRTVTGSLNYEVAGWFVTNANIGFLMPLTVINLGALVALALAMIIAKDGGYMYHPSHPRPVTYYKHMDREEQIPDEWMYQVSVRPTTTLEEYFDKNA